WATLVPTEKALLETPGLFELITSVYCAKAECIHRRQTIAIAVLIDFINIKVWNQIYIFYIFFKHFNLFLKQKNCIFEQRIDYAAVCVVYRCIKNNFNHFIDLLRDTNSHPIFCTFYIKISFQKSRKTLWPTIWQPLS